MGRATLGLVLCASLVAATASDAPPAAPAPNPNKISVLKKGDPVARKVGRWYVGQQNEQLGKYSSSELSLKNVLHAMVEKDTVEINQDSGAYVYQYNDKGNTYSLVMFTEQSCKSKLYGMVEIPLWEVRNATIYKSKEIQDYYTVVKEHVPPRKSVSAGSSDVLGLMHSTVHHMNVDAGYERFEYRKVFAAEKQQLDMDFVDLFYEKGRSMHKTPITLTYLLFAVQDLEHAVIKRYIASVYTGPDKKSKVVQLMDVEEHHDILDFDAGGVPLHPEPSGLGLSGGGGLQSWMPTFGGAEGAHGEMFLVLSGMLCSAAVYAVGFLVYNRWKAGPAATREGIQLLRRANDDAGGSKAEPNDIIDM